MIHDLCCFEVGKQWPIADKDTLNRWKRYAANRDSYNSEHPQWLRDIRDLDVLREARVFVDFYGRLTRSWADMLFGEAPAISHAGDAESAYLRDLMLRTDLLNECYLAALDTSSLGDGLLKVRLDDGRVDIDFIAVAIVDEFLA